MRNYVIVQKTNKGIHIGQNNYTETDALARLERMKAAGHKNLKVMQVDQALGLNK